MGSLPTADAQDTSTPCASLSRPKHRRECIKRVSFSSDGLRQRRGQSPRPALGLPQSCQWFPRPELSPQPWAMGLAIGAIALVVSIYTPKGIAALRGSGPACTINAVRVWLSRLLPF